MIDLEDFSFDIETCKREVSEFGILLQTPELDERETILPFFSTHKHFSAFIGSYSPG